MMTGRSNAVRLLAVTTTTVAAAFGLAGTLGIRINLSPSLPIGFYRVTSDRRSPIVEFCPPEPYATLARMRGYRPRGGCPDGGMPLMKPVVAVSGDRVNISPKGIAVNGALLPNTAPRADDADGRPLLHWPYREYRVAPGFLWVASTYEPRSFDSRYFGPIAKASVTARLVALLTVVTHNKTKFRTHD